MIIVSSSNKELIGKKFLFKKSRKKQLNYNYISTNKNNVDKGFKINADKVIDALIEGYNPTTGEIYEDSSIWKHPQIAKDLKLFLEKINNIQNKKVTNKRKLLN